MHHQGCWGAITDRCPCLATCFCLHSLRSYIEQSAVWGQPQCHGVPFNNVAVADFCACVRIFWEAIKLCWQFVAMAVFFSFKVFSISVLNAKENITIVTSCEPWGVFDHLFFKCVANFRRETTFRVMEAICGHASNTLWCCERCISVIQQFQQQNYKCPMSSSVMYIAFHKQ